MLGWSDQVVKSYVGSKTVVSANHVGGNGRVWCDVPMVSGHTGPVRDSGLSKSHESDRSR